MNSQTALIAGLVVAALAVVFVLFAVFGKRGPRQAALWKYTEQLDQARKLIERKQYTEAETILHELARQPDAPGNTFHMLAISAERRNDQAQALRMWRTLSRRFPTASAGYTGEAGLLIRMGEMDKAEQLLKKARSQVIVVGDLTKVLAEAAQAREDWQQADTLWAQVRREKPAEVEAYLNGRLCLLALGRPEPAQALLADAAMRFPSDKLVRLAVEKAAGAQPGA